MLHDSKQEKGMSVDFTKNLDSGARLMLSLGYTGILEAKLLPPKQHHTLSSIDFWPWFRCAELVYTMLQRLKI